VHEEPWPKVTVALFDRQTDYLDRLALDIQQQTHLRLTRAELIRAALDALETAALHISDDGPALTLGKPLTRIDLKPDR
jgi:hypothetical protein